MGFIFGASHSDGHHFVALRFAAHQPTAAKWLRKVNRPQPTIILRAVLASARFLQRASKPEGPCVSPCLLTIEQKVSQCYSPLVSAPE
jgi:hypothetical protein